VPLLIAIDQEGGNVARLGPSNGFNATPTAYQLGTVINQESFTRGIAGTMASWFVSTGLNLNLAPVVDVDVNPTSPAIGALDRSFSADAEVVALHAGWFMDEFHKKNVLTTLKHFPGHGSATTDSHTGFTDVTHTWSAGELVPYTRLINQHVVDAVMTAHVFNSTIDSVYPATLSPPTINGILRTQLGYTGVVISDAMGMKAISTMYGADQAIELAVRAGVDILLYTTNLDSTGKSLPAHIVDVIERSVLDGRLTAERIDSSYTRIRSLKNRITTEVASPGPEGLPQTLALANYPNPFNPSTTIRFTLPRGANVRMEIFNLLGSTVAAPVNEYLAAGDHRYAFDGSHLASGVYFCRLQADGLVQTIRMMVLK
jgi:beta-N-acetylhexosaminidase